MRRVLIDVTIALVWICTPAYASEHAQVVPVPRKAPEVSTKPNSEEALSILKAGNLRFAADKAIHPHANLLRLKQAGAESQGQHAFATILACSDSRVPVERIFDAGVMDLFVIRVAGNVCNGDQAGSIEYGLAHVNTPLLVVMGHTQCGAVTAVAQALQGKAHSLERNIPGMIASIQPAVKRVMQGEEGMNGPNLVEKAIEENVWQAIENLFMSSPRTRELVSADKVRVVGAVYDVGTGRVRWLSESKVYRLLGRTESDPRRALNAFADGHDDDHAPAAAKTASHAAPVHDRRSPPHTISHAAPTAHSDTKHTDHSEAAHGDGHDAHDAPAKSGHGEAADTHAAPKKEPAARAPAAPKKDPHAKSSEAKKSPEKQDSPGKETNGHDKESAEKKGGEHAEDSEHGEEKAEAAEAAPAKTKPWMLIGVAGGVAVAGLVLLLLGMKSAKAAPASDGHGADAHAAEAQANSAPAH